MLREESKTEKELRQALIELRKKMAQLEKSKKQIQASLKEKEVLLKEVHHRVKNNLQFIFSLLNLQSQYVKDERALGMLKNCQHRIRSMQLIHERMYQSQESGKIEFARYIRSLIAYLFQSYNVYPNLISLKMELENILLDINTAIPCGLIINELLSNSLKHAFPKDKFSGKEENLKKEIHIKLSSNSKGLMTLVVGDNGVGLPEELDLRQAETMGLKLVRDLVGQLNGTLILERKGGTEFKISFSPKK
jgi:two-component sensor histidine kinase